MPHCARHRLSAALVFLAISDGVAASAEPDPGQWGTRAPLLEPNSEFAAAELDGKLYALGGYWGIGLPLGALLAFGFGMGGTGIWIGLATGIGVVAVLMICRWQARERLGLLDQPG